MLLREFSNVLELAMILEDRIDFAVYMLPESTRAQKLLSELGHILDKEAVTDNINTLKQFIAMNSEEIEELDEIARKKIEENPNGKEKEKPT